MEQADTDTFNEMPQSQLPPARRAIVLRGADIFGCSDKAFSMYGHLDQFEEDWPLDIKHAVPDYIAQICPDHLMGQECRMILHGGEVRCTAFHICDTSKVLQKHFLATWKHLS